MSKQYGLDVLTERDVNEEIAKVAYELYKQRGMGDGYDFEDWVKAEKIVISEHEKLQRDEIDLMNAAVNAKIASRTPRKRKKT
jgi:hypothetical protein